MLKKKILGVLLLGIYCLSGSFLISFHSHDHSHDQFLYCDNYDVVLGSEFKCGHAGHLIAADEKCLSCDYFSNCDPVFLFEIQKTEVQFLSDKNKELVKFLYLENKRTPKNKSPPATI